MTPGQPEKKKMSTIVLVLIIAAAACIPCTGILAAIAIPNFIRFQARSKQSECKTQLKAAYTAEKAFYGEKDGYTTHTDELGWSGAGGRYTYVFTDEDRTDRSAFFATRLGVAGQCPECQITIGCFGNVDNDSTLDTWSVSTAERTIDNGKRIPAGTVYNDFSDITDSQGE